MPQNLLTQGLFLNDYAREPLKKSLSARCRVVKKAIHFLLLVALSSLHPSFLYSAEYGLGELLRTALVKAERIQIVEKNREIAEEGKNKRRAGLLPRLTSYGAVTWFSEMKKTPDTTILPGLVLPGTIYQPDYMGQWGIRVDQSLNLYGKEIRDYAISRDNLERQEADIRGQKEEYLTSVAMAYYDALRATKNLEIAEAAVKRLKLHRDSAEKRLKIGEVTRTVLLRAEGELSGALSDRVKAINALEIAKTYLANLAGVEGDLRLREEMGEENSVPGMEECIRRALENRPEVIAARWELKMAREQVQSARSNHWPSVVLSGVYGRYDQCPGQATTNRESIYGQLSLNFPLFEGGLRSAEVREAIIKEKQALLRYEEVKKAVKVEVEAAYWDFISSREVIKALQDQLKFARDNFQAVSRQFDYGLANSIDVMDAHTLLVSAERQLASAVYAKQASLMRLKRAMGAFLTDVMGINRESKKGGDTRG